MNYIQPQFVKFNSNSNLPEQVQNKYFVNYSIGLIYFDGISAIYVDINSVDKLFEFVKQFSTDINILFTGTDDFVRNEDYYLNESLYFSLNSNFGSSDYSADIDSYFYGNNVQLLNDDIDEIVFLPNYIINSGVNTEYFEEIDTFNELQTYFAKKNKYSDYEFTEEELYNFYATFAGVILQLNVFEKTTPLDLIYEKVLTYFNNFKSDEAAISISLILGSMFASVQNNTNMGCGCNNSIVTGNYDAQCSASCIDYYKQAMLEYLKTMLGNYNFYQDWFFIHDEILEDKVNQELIYQLKTLITEFLSLDINIGLSTATNNKCACPAVDTNSDACNRGIISNYLKVLEYVEQNQIEENINKIKIYGEQFAELLPKLQF